MKNESWETLANVHRSSKYRHFFFRLFCFNNTPQAWTLIGFEICTKRWISICFRFVSTLSSETLRHSSPARFIFISHQSGFPRIEKYHPSSSVYEMGLIPCIWQRTHARAYGTGKRANDGKKLRNDETINDALDLGLCAWQNAIIKNSGISQSTKRTWFLCWNVSKRSCCFASFVRLHVLAWTETLVGIVLAFAKTEK